MAMRAVPVPEDHNCRSGPGKGQDSHPASAWASSICRPTHPPRRWASSSAAATLPSVCRRRPASTFGSVRRSTSVRVFHFGLSKVNCLEVSLEIPTIHPYDTTNTDSKNYRGIANNLKASYRSRNQMSSSARKPRSKRGVSLNYELSVFAFAVPITMAMSMSREVRK